MRIPFIEMHGTVVYLPSAQGGIYAVFALPLSRDRHALTKQQSFRYFVYLLGFGIVMRAMLRGPRSTLEPVMSAGSIPFFKGRGIEAGALKLFIKPPAMTQT